MIGEKEITNHGFDINQSKKRKQEIYLIDIIGIY